MDFTAAVSEFFYSNDFTPDSRRFYVRTLDAFHRWATAQGLVDVGGITGALLRRYAAHLRETTSERTGRPLTGVSQHGYMNALRTFLNFCAREEWLDERIPRRLDMPKQEKKVLQVLSAEQVQLLLRATAASEAPMRDRALLAVLLDAGLRVAELCRLTLDDTHFEREDVWLMLHGKGRKEREVPLGHKARLHLHHYIHGGRQAPSGEWHVFLGRRGPLTQTGVDRALYLLRDEAGARHFAGVRVSAHTLRHTFAVNFLAAGGDVYRLSRLMGHTAVAITERYLMALNAKQARTGCPSVLDSL